MGQYHSIVSFKRDPRGPYPDVDIPLELPARLVRLERSRAVPAANFFLQFSAPNAEQARAILLRMQQMELDDRQELRRQTGDSAVIASQMRDWKWKHHHAHNPQQRSPPSNDISLTSNLFQPPPTLSALPLPLASNYQTSAFLPLQMNVFPSFGPSGAASQSQPFTTSLNSGVPQLIQMRAQLTQFSAPLAPPRPQSALPPQSSAFVFEQTSLEAQLGRPSTASVKRAPIGISTSPVVTTSTRFSPEKVAIAQISTAFPSLSISRLQVYPILSCYLP